MSVLQVADTSTGHLDREPPQALLYRALNADWYFVQVTTSGTRLEAEHFSHDGHRTRGPRMLRLLLFHRLVDLLHGVDGILKCHRDVIVKVLRQRLTLCIPVDDSNAVIAESFESLPELFQRHSVSMPSLSHVLAGTHEDRLVSCSDRRQELVEHLPVAILELGWGRPNIGREPVALVVLRQELEEFAEDLIFMLGEQVVNPEARPEP